MPFVTQLGREREPEVLHRRHPSPRSFTAATPPQPHSHVRQPHAPLTRAPFTRAPLSLARSTHVHVLFSPSRRHACGPLSHACSHPFSRAIMCALFSYTWFNPSLFPTRVLSPSHKQVYACITVHAYRNLSLLS
ncbi:hypothetical protein AMTRI_Chr13g121270 [Amborella trichopoda]